MGEVDFKAIAELYSIISWFSMPFLFWGLAEFMLWAENDFKREPKKEKPLRRYLKRLLKRPRAA